MTLTEKEKKNHKTKYARETNRTKNINNIKNYHYNNDIILKQYIISKISLTNDF